jgi:plastocyanin
MNRRLNVKRNFSGAVRAPIVVLLALLLTNFLACGPRSEPPEAPTAQGEHPNAPQAPGEVAPPEAIPAPSAPSGIWTAIVSKRDTIDALIKSNQLKGIHAQTQALGTLANQLLNGSTMLDEDKLARVRGAVNQMGHVADSLHDAADKGDAAGTAAEFQKLDMLLKLIEAQYPAGALSSGMPQGMNAAPDGAGAAVAQDPHAQHNHTDEAAQEPIPPDAQRVSIRANDFSFAPKEITVKAKRPVAITVTNAGTTAHDWVIAAKPEVHIHVLPGRSETRVFTFDTPGQYPVTCTLPGHKQLGMVGKIVIL